MIKIFKNELDDEVVRKIKTIEDNSWINLVNPTKEEISTVVETLKISEDLITKVLDEEELPRIEKYDNAYLTITTENTEEKNYIRRERRTGKYQRSFYIGGIDKEKIDAKFENGILEIVMPKKEEVKSPNKINMKIKSLLI